MNKNNNNKIPILHERNMQAQLDGLQKLVGKLIEDVQEIQRFLEDEQDGDSDEISAMDDLEYAPPPKLIKQKQYDFSSLLSKKN